MHTLSTFLLGSSSSPITRGFTKSSAFIPAFTSFRCYTLKQRLQDNPLLQFDLLHINTDSRIRILFYLLLPSPFCHLLRLCAVIRDVASP